MNIECRTTTRRGKTYRVTFVSDDDKFGTEMVRDIQVHDSIDRDELEEVLRSLADEIHMLG